MKPETTDSVDAFEDLLDEERRALLAGDFEALGRLLMKKEQIIGELAELEGVDSAEMAGLSSRVARNQELLATAIDGIRSVSRRLAELHRVRGSFETYDERGKRQSVASRQDRSLEKRA